MRHWSQKIIHMTITIEKINEKASTPTIIDNAIQLSCIDLLTEVGRDGRLILIYRTGLSITIPEGHIGIITPTRLSPIYSLDDAAGIQVLRPGKHDEIIARYKVNTNSVPSIFELGEEFGRLIIIPSPSIDLNTIDYVAKEHESTGNTEDTGADKDSQGVE